MRISRCVYEGFSAGMGIVACSGKISYALSPKVPGDTVWKTIQVLRRKSGNKGAKLYLCDAHAKRARKCGLKVECLERNAMNAL